MDYYYTVFILMLFLLSTRTSVLGDAKEVCESFSVVCRSNGMLKDQRNVSYSSVRIQLVLFGKGDQ